MSAKRGTDAERRFEEVVDSFALDRRLARIAAAFRGEQTRRTPRRFGSGALKADGKMFAMVVRDHLVVKLPEHRVAMLVQRGQGEHFNPRHGRLMKEWVVILDEKCSWVRIAQEAYAFCVQQTAKRKRSES